MAKDPTLTKTPPAMGDSPQVRALTPGYLRNNPGWVGKHYGWLVKDHAKRLAEAGYYTRKTNGKWYLRNPYTKKGGNLWSWSKNPGTSYKTSDIPPKATKITGDVAGSTTTKPPKGDSGSSSGSSSGGSSSGGGQTLTLTGGKWEKYLAQLLAMAQKQASTNPLSGSVLSKGYLDKYLNQNPMVDAETDASLQYDGVINDIRGQMRDMDAGLPGVLGDLDKWYGMVGSANEAAKKSNAETLAANVGEFGDAAQAFMSAAGGAAQPGNASVAAQAVISDAALRGMGQAQSNFDNNIGQFFQQAGASQKAGILSQMNQQRAQLARELTSATRERGAYKSKSYSDKSDKYAGLALDLGKTIFDQRESAANMAWNRLLGIGNLAGMASTVGSTVDQNDIKTAQGVEDWKRQIILNEQERLRLKQFQDTYGGGEQSPFSALDPGGRAKLAAALQENLLGPKGYLTVNPNQFLSTIKNRLYNVAGYNQTPETETFVRSLLEPRYINWWNKYHPKQKYTP